MNHALLWKRITSHPLFNTQSDPPRNSAPDLSSDPLPNLSTHPAPAPLSSPLPDPPSAPFRLSGSLPETTPSPGERVHALFPPGLGSNSKSCKEQPYIFTPHLLFNTLKFDRSEHAPHIFVKSVWYGKQEKSAKHEFIIIQIGDLKIPDLDNYIALDRNQGSPSRRASSGSMPASKTNANDAFRVSYDGDLHRFLNECELTSYLKLEQIHFHPDESLKFLDLVVLVHHISRLNPIYNPLDTNCYWFTGLIWECMRKMCPKAEYEVLLPGRRGKIGFARCVPNPVQVWKVLRAVGIEPPSSESPQDQIDPTNYAGANIAKTSIDEEGVVAGGGMEIECFTCCRANSSRR